MSALRQNRWLLVPLATLLIVGLSYAVSAVGRAAEPADGAPGEVPGAAVAGSTESTGTAGTDARIAFWQARIAATPTSDQAWLYLGELFAQKGRQTGDLTWYTRADEAFRRSLELYEGSVAARTGLARTLVTLHRFREAVAEGTKILAADPGAVDAVAIVGDASLELGDLDTATAAFETLRRVQDGPAADIRFARLAFLAGRTDEAIRLAERAATTAQELNAPADEVAFHHHVSGEYRFSRGDVDGADAAYRAALDAFPGYHPAVAGRGRVAFARGDLDAAISWLRSAVAIVPRAETLGYLGDLYVLRGGPGDAALAKEQYAAVDVIATLGEGQPGVFDRELVLFFASHGRRVDRALELATAELAERTDVYGWDAFAWALLAAGRSQEALAPARAALALGTRDARLLFHVGLIEIAAGEADAGRAHLREALALNPWFDPLGARAAQEALR